MRKKDLSPARQKRLVPVDSHPGALALVPPKTPHRLDGIKAHDELRRAHESLNLLKDLSDRLPNPDLITRTADRREAVRSSQIEGTSSEVDDLLTYEVTGNDEGMPPDVHVTKNYLIALQYGLEKVRKSGASAINCLLVKELHAHLMADIDYMGEPGSYREKQNWIGGGRRIYNAIYVPPPPENVAACMDDLETLLQYSPSEEEQMVLSVITRMAIAHVQFESIHPFTDGNGRVGRILLPLMLAAEGYPPVYLAGYLKDNQRDYYDALAGVQLKGRWSDWIKFFAIGMESAARESIRTGLALERVLTKWQSIVNGMGLRSHNALLKLPELMIGTPILTAHKVKEALDISFPSASAALGKMGEIGILTQTNEYRRNRVFIASEVIDILNQPADF